MLVILVRGHRGGSSSRTRFRVAYIQSLPFPFLCRSRSRIRVLPPLDKRQAPQLGRTVKRIYTKFKLDRKQQGCFPRFPKGGATTVVSELGKVVRRPMRSSGQVPLEIPWCVPDVPGIFLHLIQNSTSYQNRKPRSGTPSSVVPPEIPCSSHCLRAEILLCHRALFNDHGRVAVQTHHSGSCSGRCHVRRHAEGRSEEAHAHRPFVVDV